MAHKQFTDNAQNATKVYIYLWHKKKKLQTHDGVVYFGINDTVLQAKEVYKRIEPPKDRVGGGNAYQGMTWNGTKGVLDDNQKLSKYANKNGRVKIIVTYKVHGGSNNDIKDDEKIDINNNDNGYTYDFFSLDHPNCKKNRILDRELDIEYPLSKDKDIITFDIHKDNIKMSCGHTVHPNTLYKIMLSVFIVNKYSYKIHCPKKKCNKEWNFDDCARYAVLDDDEYDLFEDEIICRKNPTRSCPHCDRQCSRPENLKYFRVACICAKGNWCFECGDTWKGGGFTVCGNDDCDLNDINDILKNCETEYTVGKIKVPKLRACPSCYALIEHTQACRHMHCKNCGVEFCFVCLKAATMKSNGTRDRWNCPPGCGDDGFKAAPIQTIK